MVREAVKVEKKSWKFIHGKFISNIQFVQKCKENFFKNLSPHALYATPRDLHLDLGQIMLEISFVMAPPGTLSLINHHSGDGAHDTVGVGRELAGLLAVSMFT